MTQAASRAIPPSTIGPPSRIAAFPVLWLKASLGNASGAPHLQPVHPVCDFLANPFAEYRPIRTNN